MSVRIGSEPPKPLTLRSGENVFDLFLPEVVNGASATAEVRFNDRSVATTSFQHKPARPMTVYVLPHSHTDIGYTEIQSAVEAKQVKNVADGIAAARKTAAYPEGSRFVWNVEVGWAADLFLERMNEQQREEFYEAVRKGQIALNGMYLNELTALCRPEELVQLFRFATKVSDKTGVPIDVAMISDVFASDNGYFLGDHGLGDKRAAYEEGMRIPMLMRYAAAQFARALGRTNEFETLMRYSRGWEQLFDSETGFIRPKDHDGKFIADFEPRKPWIGFQEGNAWQYTFYVPHDPDGLIRKMGLETFRARLADIFAQAEKTEFGGGKKIDAFSGLENVYNQGNQPSLHIAWLFNYAGQPELTHHWVRRICDVFYGTDAVHGYGYGQDEDQGPLGAWFVLAGIGLFDVQGGASADPVMQIGAPLFEKIQIQLHPRYHSGKTIVIEAKGADAARRVSRVKVNGAPWNQWSIPWKTLTSGANLSFEFEPTVKAQSN